MLKRQRQRMRTMQVQPHERYVLRAYRLLSQETRRLIVTALDELGGLPALKARRDR